MGVSFWVGPPKRIGFLFISLLRPPKTGTLKKRQIQITIDNLQVLDLTPPVPGLEAVGR